MQINVVFKNFIQRNEKSGISKFVVQCGDKELLCSGVIPEYPKKIPVTLTGEYETVEGYTYFSVSNFRVCGYNKEVVIRFLSGEEFKDIGQIAAKKILDKTGADIFEFARNTENVDAIISLLNLSSVSNSVLVKLFRQLKRYTDFEQVYDYFIGCGSDYYLASRFFEKCEDKPMKAINDNPYVMLISGMEYEKCEAVALKQNMECCDPKRLNAIVYYAMKQHQNSGNTCIHFKDLIKRVKIIEEKCKNGYTTNPIFIAEEVCKDRYYIENRAGDILIYFSEDYEREQIIADNLQRLSLHMDDTQRIIPDIAKIESACDVTYSPEQRKAFDCLKTSGVYIITGGPGTGKTTLLNGLIYAYEKISDDIIALCAPTGAAARKMAQSTGKPAQTIHRLLGIRPFENEIISYQQIDAGLIIIDETSMVDTFLMARLLMSIKNGATVIFLGDADQLPSVGAGNIMADIISSKKYPVYKLTEIFRQKEGSTIIENSKKILKGNANLVTDKHFVIKNFDTEEEVIENALFTVSQLSDRGYPYKLYTPSRNPKFASGTVRMNRAIQQKTNNGKDVCVIYGYYIFHKGDYIIFCENNYEKGYFNSQEGIITDIQKHNGRSYITVETEGMDISLSGNEIADLELGYAITAHKSQGGETDNAIILVPKKPISMLQRKLLYVEITRAKKNVLMLTEADALNIAASNFAEKKRQTGLFYKLTG